MNDTTHDMIDELGLRWVPLEDFDGQVVVYRAQRLVVADAAFTRSQVAASVARLWARAS